MYHINQRPGNMIIYIIIETHFEEKHLHCTNKRIIKLSRKKIAICTVNEANNTLPIMLFLIF